MYSDSYILDLSAIDPTHRTRILYLVGQANARINQSRNGTLKTVERKILNFLNKNIHIERTSWEIANAILENPATVSSQLYKLAKKEKVIRLETHNSIFYLSAS